MGERKRKASECIIWGKRRKIDNRMSLLGATHNVWCNKASATIVGATVVVAAAVGGWFSSDWCGRGRCVEWWAI